jgi:hypothetical protein
MSSILLRCITTAATLMATAGLAYANAPLSGQSARAEALYSRVINSALATRTVTLAAKPANGRQLPALAVTGVASGQAGYVHYFLIKLPDDTLEVQVGIELADQRIAWSFPGLGVAVSPFIDAGEISAGGPRYEVWHLYGLRPAGDAGSIAKLQRELPGRVERWVKTGIPYCLDDAPKQNCMSCLGFVMRALFPGRDGYPAPPRDFSRTTNPSRYTPNDLLLYLTGMLELPDRNARLQRIQALKLPADLHHDLEKLVYAMGVDTPPQSRASAPRASEPRRRL